MVDAIIITIILVIVFLIIRSFVKNKAKGISSGCGCGCGSCPMSGQCHGKDSDMDGAENHDNKIA